MNKTFVLCALVLLAAVTLMAWQNEERNVRFRYEYCVLPLGTYSSSTRSDIAGTNEGQLRVCYADSGGCRWETITQASSGGGQGEGFSRTVAKALYQLGNAGWELAGGAYEGQSTTQVLYFKRRQ